MKSAYGKLNNLALPLCLSFLVGLLAVSNDSLWIDEGLTAMKATAPTLSIMWQRLWLEHNTNLHMMLYMICVWGWEKIFGSSEWALRGMNIPFYMAGVTALWIASPRVLRSFVLALSITSPFLWFYLNEARTYSMLFGFAAVITACLVFWSERKDSEDFPLKRWVWTITLCCVGVVWTHVVGLVFEVGVLLYLLLYGGPRIFHRILRLAPVAVATAGILHICLLAYVFWTQHNGVESNAIGKTSVVNVAFWIYEFFGFQGLGPARNILRTLDFGSFLIFLPTISILTLLWCAGLALGVRRIPKTDWKGLLLLTFCLIVVPLALFLLIGHLKGIRFLPRYAATSFPAFILLCSAILEQTWKSGFGKFVAITLVAFLLSSSLLLRFHPSHKRDDYRAAAKLATSAATSGYSVLWAADVETANYYGISFDTNPQGKVQLKRFDRFDRNTPLPPVILLSKRDIYDSDGWILMNATAAGYTESKGANAFSLHLAPSVKSIPRQ